MDTPAPDPRSSPPGPDSPAPPVAPPPCDWIVFDLETTGLSSEFEEIIQIAAVRVCDGRILESESFFSYVNPQRSIPSFITQYTGVSNADVRNAPTIAEILPAFSRFVGDRTLLAHNGHRFDMKFLHAACRRTPHAPRPVSYHDSLALSWQLWGKRGVRHGLDAVLSRLQIYDNSLRRHDARGDVQLLARAAIEMRRRLIERGLSAEIPRHESILPHVTSPDSAPSSSPSATHS